MKSAQGSFKVQAAFIGLAIALAALGMLGGCSTPNPVGGRITQTQTGTTLDSPSPVTLTIADLDKSGTASGTGPARFSSVTESGVQTLQTGSVPNDVYFQMPGGSKFTLSTGNNITADSLAFDPKTGTFSIKKFTTNAADPLRAANEGLDRLVQIVATLTPAQRDAQIAYWEEQAKTAQGITKSVIEGIIIGIKGGV